MAAASKSANTGKYGRVRITAPSRKTNIAGLGGAFAVVIVTVLGAFGIELDPRIAGAVATILSFVAAYLVPLGGAEQTEQTVAVEPPREPTRQVTEQRDEDR